MNTSSGSLRRCQHRRRGTVQAKPDSTDEGRQHRRRRTLTTRRYHQSHRLRLDRPAALPGKFHVFQPLPLTSTLVHLANVQTYLAGYFCVIDFALVFQFFYYQSVNPPAPTSLPPPTAYPAYTPTYNSSPSLHASLILSHSTHGLPPRAASQPGGHRTRSTSSPAMQPLSAMPLPSESMISGTSDATARPRIRRQGTTHGSSSTLESPGLYTDRSYAAIYEAALDVARTAERVSARRSQSRRRRLTRQSTANHPTTSDEEAGDGGDRGELHASFHSELSGRSGASSSSTIEGDYRHMTSSTGTLLEAGDPRVYRDRRGRTLRRQPSLVEALSPYESEDQATPLAHPGHATPGHSSGQEGYSDEARRDRKREKSRSLSLARGSSGRGGRRAAGVAFMSLGLIARGWYGTYSPSTPIWATPLSSSGQVLSRPISSVVPSRHPPLHPFPASRAVSSSASASNLRLEPHEDGTTLVWIQEERQGSHEHGDHGFPDQPFSFQRIVGRVSAWACTTLYLTSRLPQIWKNVSRSTSSSVA